MESQNVKAQSIRVNQYTNPPMPVFHSLKPLVDIMVEKESATEFDGPGQYCYKKVSLAIDQVGTVIQSRKLILSCPYCNKVQFLQSNNYTWVPDSNIPLNLRIKKTLNNFLDKLFGYEPFKVYFPGIVTVDGEVICEGNKLHKFYIFGNRIEHIDQHRNIVRG